MYIRWVPLLCVWKIEPEMLSRKKKSVGVAPPKKRSVSPHDPLRICARSVDFKSENKYIGIHYIHRENC